MIHDAAIIAGCTGQQSLSAAELRSLDHGPVLFSASSSNVELALPGDSRFHEDMVVRGPGHQYVVLGAGFPINFSGRSVLNPPERMQFICAALAGGVVQAAERLASPRTGPHDLLSLDRATDERIFAMARAVGMAPLS
jgi:hypothetical protein